MTDKNRYDCDVLISGGGPTGVALGLLLAQAGISVIIAEREAEIYPLPRAAHIDDESMRILQSVGVANDVIATCRQSERYDFLNANGDVLLRFEGLAAIARGGWPGGNFIHQPSLETALRNALHDNAQIELRTQCALKSFEQGIDSVTAQLTTPQGSTTLTARYLVGADGARSLVRTALGVEFEDLNFDESWLVVDAIVHDFERLPKINLQICDPERPTTCVLMGNGRHRWEFMIKPGETPEQVSADAFVEKLLEPWDVRDAVTLERKAVYRFNARLAKAWRQNRVLLAGDAAHQTPPFAGQGLCAGLRDASNLAWKLVVVMEGVADNALLDTYQYEREPHVRAVIGMAMMMGQTVCITDPRSAAMRDQQMLEARAAGHRPDGRPSYPEIADGFIAQGTLGAGSYFPQPCAVDNPAQKLDDVMGAGAWLISREKTLVGDGRALRRSTLDDQELEPFKGVLSTWLDSHNAEAVLVRPDRYVFGTGMPENLVDAFVQAKVSEVVA